MAACDVISAWLKNVSNYKKRMNSEKQHLGTLRTTFVKTGTIDNLNLRFILSMLVQEFAKGVPNHRDTAFLAMRKLRIIVTAM